MSDMPFYALKVRVNAEGKQNLRTLALIGAYPTFGAACDGAVRACRAKRQDEDRHEWRYLVRCRASVPGGVFARQAAGKRRWELERERQSA